MGIADLLQQRKREKAAANLKAGEDFLAKNALRPEVTVTSSGLQYEVITPSETEQYPKATQQVTCHYTGMLLDGKVFDSSIQRGRPATFPLNKVIAGWTEGLQLMNIGSTYKFYIPSHLGYGDRQVGSDIPPNSLLIFEVSLINIQ